MFFETQELGYTPANEPKIIVYKRDIDKLIVDIFRLSLEKFLKTQFTKICHWPDITLQNPAGKATFRILQRQHYALKKI